MRTPEEVIGVDAVMALQFAGYQIVECQQSVDLLGPAPNDFETLWEVYPHKVGKPAALRAYKAARNRKIKPETILTGLRLYIETKPTDRPWLNLSTFINQDRWNDAPAPVFKQAKGADLFFQSAVNDHGQDARSEGDPRLASGGLPQRGLVHHAGHR